MSLPILDSGIDALEQCVAHALVDPWSGRATLNIEVVSLIHGDVGFVDVGVHQAVRISLSSHCTLEVTDEHALGTCFQCSTFSY